jgi:hypothetical protein
MFVQGVDMDLTESREYTADLQSYTSPSLAAYCYAKLNYDQIFGYLLFYAFVIYFFWF